MHIAFTAVSMVPNAVIKITGRSSSICRIRSRRSTPLMPGIFMSVTTTSGRLRATVCQPYGIGCRDHGKPAALERGRHAIPHHFFVRPRAPCRTILRLLAIPASGFQPAATIPDPSDESQPMTPKPPFASPPTWTPKTGGTQAPRTLHALALTIHLPVVSNRDTPAVRSP